MQYTQSEFRHVEHEFLEEFQMKTQEFYDQNVNGNNIFEYKKILNQIKTRRSEAMQKKNKCQWLHKRGRTIDLSGVRQSYFPTETNQPANQLQKQIEQEQGEGFYLTEKVQEESRKENLSRMQDVAKQNSVVRSVENCKQGACSRLLLKSRAETIAMEHPENENLNLQDLNDRIYGQYSVLECLQHEQSQVQQAIFCFKKRIIAMEEQLNSEGIKSKEIDRLLSQNVNQMIRAKHTNQQVKSMLLKTKKHFDLDLDGRKQLQVKFGENNKSQLDQSIVNHIHLKKMKQHLAEQEKKLSKLNMYRHELEKKQNKYQSIYLKEQELYKTYEQIKAIELKQCNKKNIVSILDKQFEQFDSNSQKDKRNSLQKANNQSNNSSQKLNSLSIQRSKDRHCRKTSIKDQKKPQQSGGSGKPEQPQASRKKLSRVVRDIVELYRLMKHQEGASISQFKQLIHQRDEKEAEHARVISRLSCIYQTIFDQNIPQSPEDQLRFQLLSKQLHKLKSKSNFLTLSSNGIESRLKYYIGRLITIIRKIINTWIKTDKLSAKYIETVALKLLNAVSTDLPLKANLNSNNLSIKQSFQLIDERQLSVEDSRNLLIACFENFQAYFPFLDIIHDTSFIYRFMTKPKLFRLFKRVIKTKIHRKNIPTEDILEKALSLCFDEGRATQLQRIENLLNVFRDIFAYLTNVSNGSIRLNCAVNYDLPVEVRQIESQQQSKLPSLNELQRYSTKLQSKGNDRVSLGKKHQSKLQGKGPKRKHTETKTFLPGNMKEEEVISKLKKKKHYKAQLNIHDFYEDLREQIQKVNKISAF